MAKNAITVGVVIAQGKHLALKCNVCNTASTRDLNEEWLQQPY